MPCKECVYVGESLQNTGYVLGSQKISQIWDQIKKRVLKNNILRIWILLFMKMVINRQLLWSEGVNTIKFMFQESDFGNLVKDELELGRTKVQYFEVVSVVQLRGVKTEVLASLGEAGNENT